MTEPLHHCINCLSAHEGTCAEYVERLKRMIEAQLDYARSMKGRKEKWAKLAIERGNLVSTWESLYKAERNITWLGKLFFGGTNK